MHSWKTCALLGVLIAAALSPARAQNERHTYQSFNANVPFSFSVGDRKFHAGYYEFVVRGPGLMVMRDAHAHVLATFFTRDLKGTQREVPPRLVFELKDGNSRLSSIWMGKGAQGFEFLREEVAIRQKENVPPQILMRPPEIKLPTTLH